MKTLLILRHAKSSWSNSALDDAERPLNARGRRTLPLMASAGILNHKIHFPVFTSPAVRARETIEGIANYSNISADIQIADSLYTFDYRDLIRWLAGINENHSMLMIVGHNPALMEFIAWITDNEQNEFPTCAYAELSINADTWADLKAGSAKLKYFLKPEWISYKKFKKKQSRKYRYSDTSEQYLKNMNLLIAPALLGFDFEFLHQFRINTRKLFTSYKTYSSRIKDKTPLTTVKSLTDIYLNFTNPIRDRDVMLLNLPEWKNKLPGIFAIDFQKFQNFIVLQKQSLYEEFKNYIISSEHAKLLNESQAASRLLDSLSRKSYKIQKPSRTRKKRFKKLLEAHASLTVQSDDGAFHQFRLKVKKFRYQLKLARKQDKKLNKILSEFQDLLGKFNDSSVQQAFIKSAEKISSESLSHDFCSQLVQFLENEKINLKKSIIETKLKK